MADFTPPSSTSVHNQRHLQQQNQEANPTPEPPPPTSTAIVPSPQPLTPAALPSPPSSDVSNRKRRGRPRGSKNKPKTPVYVTPQPEPTMKFLQLYIPAGNDVVDMLQNFARRSRVGLHVLNGSGSISGFTLRHPPVTLSRVFNLITLGGTFVDSAVAGPWLLIFVNGNAGGVLGGTVVSKALAAADVVVNAFAFKSGSEYCCRLEPVMFAGADQKGGATVPSCSGGTGGVVVDGGAVPLSAARFGLPTQHLNWAPTAVTARPLNHHFQGFKN